MSQRSSERRPPERSRDGTEPKTGTPAPWVWPAVVAVALGPFVLTALGVAAVSLRPAPRPAAETATASVVAPFIEPDTAPALGVIVSDPEPVEPGEARPPIPGMRPPSEEPTPPPEPAPTKNLKCDRFGTAIDFVRSPTIAFQQAGREQKLVMVLHVAGYFDDPGFT